MRISISSAFLYLFVFISGQRLLETLENGVSRYPRLDGRFPQVSGIRFQFDPYKKSGERVDMNTLTINGRPLQIDKVEKKLHVVHSLVIKNCKNRG